MTLKETLNEKTTKTFLHILEKHLDSANLIEAEAISKQLQNTIKSSNSFYDKYCILNLRLYILQGKFQLALDSIKHLESHCASENLPTLYLYKAQAKEKIKSNIFQDKGK